MRPKMKALRIYCYIKVDGSLYSWQQTYPCDQIFSYLPFLWGNLACLISWFLCKSFYFLCHLPQSSN